MPRISVIVPLFNYAQFIGECLKSCLAQTMEDFEVIVVNDASTDNSFEEATKWMVKDSRIKVHNLAVNVGFAEAKNEAIRCSRGEYIVPIDADDMLTPRSLEFRLRAFDESLMLDFVHGLVYDGVGINDSYVDCLANVDKLKKNKWTQRQFTREHKGKIHAQSMMFRREVFEKYGLYYDIVSKADKEMTYRLGVHPLSPLPPRVRFKKIRKFVAFYRRHDDSMKSELDEKKKDNLKELFNKRIRHLQKEGVTKGNTPWL